MRRIVNAAVFSLCAASPALADPLDITQTSGQVGADRAARDGAADRILGAPIDDPVVVALQGGATPLAGWGEGVWFLVSPTLHLSVGDAVPVNNGGEEEPGGFSPALSLRGLLLLGPMEIKATPWIRTGFVNAGGQAVAGRIDVKDLWAGLRLGGLSVGFGREDRWLGPSRRGSLTLSDNAVPPWLGGVSGEGRLPGVLGKLGRFRGELEVGWLGEPRADVVNPGIFFLDLRWLPAPLIELGVTRMTIFGGQGRPPVDFGQLLVPTEPHVYDDPDLTLPDQDELAALDFRLCLPLRRWFPSVPVDHVEGYWQYGGEDVIGREVGPIPYPSLAGVANIYGAEIAGGPLSANVEFSRLMDDTFRWYVGHRVYHDGFTQAGRPLGNFGGTDSETIWGRLGWAPDWRGVGADAPPAWGHPRVALWGDRTRRVGVIESRNGKVFELATEEQRWRVGLDASVATPALQSRGRLSAGYSIDRTRGEDFVPGADRVAHRAWVSWSADFSRGAGRGD